MLQKDMYYLEFDSKMVKAASHINKPKLGSEKQSSVDFAKINGPIKCLQVGIF